MDRRLPPNMEQHSGNVSELAGRIIPIRPRLLGEEDAFRAFCKLLSRLVRATDEAGRHRGLEQAREEIESMGGATSRKRQVALKFVCSVIVDVVAQGWNVTTTRRGIELRSPQIDGVSPQELKRRIREGHLLERDAQLGEPSVREFIKSMERRRLGPRGWTSIFSLMRDGHGLSRILRAVTNERDEYKRLALLASAISPYLQAVEPGSVCELTGLKLGEIWRYFRHTWISTYKSLPGRGMMMLVRDAAATNHPVIGIAALGSSTAQQTLRDRWVGWDSDLFEKRVSEQPTARLARWVHESVKRLIDSIYLGDLLSERVVERDEIKHPTQRAIKRLLRDAMRAGEAHRRFPDLIDHKRNSKKVDWRIQAKTPLFRSKRAKTLATLLRIRANLYAAGFSKPTIDSLRKCLKNSLGRNAIRQLVRLVKAEHVGIDMMDIIICGAIAPYNALLGGKLVCSLLTSPEVVKFYRKRYGKQESVIASSMKGKSVKRPPNLVMLATTSLYGVGSSQYNRVRIPLEQLGGKPGTRLEYADLGVSKGYGSYHFSKASIEYLEILLGRANGGRKVNSIFGEGVNPLMRKLRDGLAEVGLPTDELLRHGNPRVVYGVALARNFRNVLLGLTKTPRYFLPTTNSRKQTDKLAGYWRRRWLAARISYPGILEEVASHSLLYPVTHGARVTLPANEPAELFELLAS
jgi:uncharacterized protein DUF4338